MEYKIKLQNDGFTITGTIDTAGAAVAAKPDAPVEQNSLAATYQESTAAASANTANASNGLSKPVSGGGPGPRLPGGSPLTDSAGPITIIGPFILLNRPEESEKTNGK